jgi:hypothetical protein
VIVYLSSCEMEDAGVTFHRHATVHPNEIRHVVLPRELPQELSSVVDVVDRICEAASNRRSIYLLVVNCHGVNQPHFGNVGLKIDSRPMTSTWLLRADNLTPFSALDGWFSDRNQGIELHACAIARGVGGRRFCQTLSNHSHATVYAGLDLQTGTTAAGADRSRYLIRETFGMAGAPDDWGYFEGPALRFDPHSVNPADAASDLRARGAWRRGTQSVLRPHDVDLYELDHPVDTTEQLD